MKRAGIYRIIVHMYTFDANQSTPKLVFKTSAQ